MVLKLNVFLRLVKFLPCTRCYDGQLLATRGYVRTTHSGDLSSTATAENCHNFQVCLPWILDVETDIQVTPIQDFEFIVVRVAFSCFSTYETESCNDNPNHNWLVEIESVVNYPWYVREQGVNTARLFDGQNTYDMISMSDVSGCNNPADNCVQKYSFNIPGCSSLEDKIVFQILGLEYDCYGDCADAHQELSNAGMLHVQGQVTLQATQDNCGLDFVIDGTDTVSLTMNPFLDDFVTPNAVFIEGDESIGAAYFKIVATSSIEVASFTIIEMSAQLDYHSPVVMIEGDQSGYYVQDCPDADNGMPSICCSAMVANMYDNLDSESELSNVNIYAQVEISYTDGSKRTVGLGSSHQLQTNIRVRHSKDAAGDEIKDSASIFALTSLIILAIF